MPGKRAGVPCASTAGMIVALAVIGLAATIVVTLSATAPVATAAVLTSAAAVLAAVPPIIRAVKGTGR